MSSRSAAWSSLPRSSKRASSGSAARPALSGFIASRIQQIQAIALALDFDALALLVGTGEALAVTARHAGHAGHADDADCSALRSAMLWVLRACHVDSLILTMQKRYHLTTFGCQMNEHDSEHMKGMLESLGYSEAPERSAADLILFNTCSIRESADSRFIAHLGEAKRLKSEQPERIVGVGGCWAQSVKEEVFVRFPFVDVAFGPGQVHKLAEFLTSDSLSAQGYFEFEGFTGELPAKRARPFQGWLQVSVGCNCACSYCIVPSTRGREVSRDPAELIDEVARLAEDGVREVTLLGQNVNSYGRDLPVEHRISFAELLTRIDAIDGVERIRYTSPHPK